MNKKAKIISLYYEQDWKPTKIAEELNVSKPYITKIIKKDNRYIKEKEKRKQQNAIKNKEETKKYIKKKKENEKRLNECVRVQHLQATMELSSKHSISNRDFRNWNKSIYNYDQKRKQYILKEEITVTNDVPKKINWKAFDL